MTEYRKFVKTKNYIEAYQLTEDTWVEIKKDNWDSPAYHGGVLGGAITAKGYKGDYVVKQPNGMCKIIRKEDFEALFVPMGE